MFKKCSKCNIEKELTNFTKDKYRKDGLHHQCKTCKNGYEKEWYFKYRNKKLLKGKLRAETLGQHYLTIRFSYNMDETKFYSLLAKQNGLCAICKTGIPGGQYNQWQIDHDHNCCPGRKTCGKCIRGLLCHKCNLGLGLFNDSPILTNAATIYLRGDK